MNKLLEIFSTYESGRSCHFVYEAKLKDEPRSFAKIAEANTRIFYMTPLEALIVMRMFLLPFFSLMVQFGDIFGSAVGIDMHRGADSLYNSLKAFSELIIEGDYKQFDLSPPYGVFECVSGIIWEVLRLMGYTESALRIVTGLLTDLNMPIISMLMDIFSAYLVMSGNYATAERNCLINLVLLMYAFYYSEKSKGKKFFDCVLPNLYGDDNLASTKERWFNNIYYQSFCKEHYNMEYTASNKSMDLDEFVTPDTMTFLKRYFLYKPVFNKYMAPLETSSLLRSLQWYLPSNFVTKEEQVLACLSSSLWEIFIALDEEEFHLFRATYVDWLVSLYGMDHTYVCKTLPIYSYIFDSLNCEQEYIVDDL
jgi:hypothetical protein